MQSHDQVMGKLREAARQGDVTRAWLVLETEHEHLAQCAICQDKIMRLSREAIEDELLLRALVRLEEHGLLEEPPVYPGFDLARLKQAAPRLLWKPASLQIANRPVRQLTPDIRLRVKVYKRKMEASFKGLTDWLSATVTPAYVPVFLPARRGSKIGKGQVLSLPDRAGNLSITLTVEAGEKGQAHLGVEVRQIEPDRLVRCAQVSLRYPKGAEVTRTKGGKATFVGLDPDEYIIEVKPLEGDQAGQVWQFAITLE